MKKYFLLLAAALMTIVSCTEKEPQAGGQDTEEPAGTIELSETSAEFGEKGGKAQILVTSSAEWTLTASATYDWITVTNEDGEKPESGIDGEVITFTVAENFETERTAEFIFAVGNAKETLTITSHPGEKPVAPFLTLVDGSEITVDHLGKRVEILVSSNVPYREIKVTVTEGTADWCKHTVNVEGAEKNQAKIVFDIPALEGLENRSSVITLSGKDVQDVTVNLTQLAQLVLSSTATEFTILPAGGTIEIPIVTNVAYSINIPDDAKEWISYTSKEGNVEKFTVLPLETGLRQTYITFAQTDALAGAEAIELKVSVIQMTSLVSFAANMDNARLYIKEAGKLPASSYNELTIECLVNASALDHLFSYVWNIPGNLGLRFGDSSDPMRFPKTNPGIELGSKYWAPFPIQFSGMSTDVWHHLAFTFKSGRVRLYIDAQTQLLVDKTISEQSINPFTSWAYDPATQKGFFIGYGTDPEQDFNGMVTEVRIWNKALSEAELKAEDHFYNVDPTSAGLMVYWKFDAGKGNTVPNRANGPDALTGNHLYGETAVKGSGNAVTGTPGIVWESVKLPVE